MSDDKPISLLKRIVAIVPTMAFAMQPMFAFANPQGGVVSAGDATISSTGKKLDIIQRSDKAVIDWRGFDINSDEATEFHQLSSSSIALNRVNSDSASHIDGKLTANGNIVILNQNGVMFGAGAKVDVNSLVVSTAGISNDDFMNSTGKLNFNQAGNENASIVNNGTITAKEAGLVGMVAPNVVNNGIITAKLGRVHLASGDTFTVDMYGDSLMEVAVSDKVKSQLVENTGVISAAGGKIGITAAAGKDIVSSLINVKGELHAPAVAQRNGEIFIYAAGSQAVKGNVSSDKGKKSGSSTVNVAAKLDVSGKNTGEHGGSVSILGDNVSLLAGTNIDASGDIGGGVVKVGGDYHGAGDTATALNTLIENGANINADAITSGNGGNVTVWSDNYTNFAGHISARGGANSGDGGFVETSGKKLLDVTGLVDAASPWGKAGIWLLDPADVVISSGADTNNTGNPNFTPNGTASVINTATIKTALDAGTSVTITTSNDGYAGNGDITVSNAITTTGSGNLTLSAYRNIAVNAAITLQGGKLTLRSDNADNHSGAISVAASITTNGGDITMGGGSGAITAGSGYAWGNAGTTTNPSYGGYSGVLITSTVNAGAGNIIVNGQGYITSANGDNFGIYVPGSLTTSTGNITVNGIGGGSGSSAINIGVYGTFTATSTGNITVTGTGGDASGSAGGNFGTYTNITGAGGAIAVTGTGGNSSNANNYGIAVNGQSITNTGTGSITLTGIAAGASNSGIGFISGGNTIGGVSNAGNITFIADTLSFSSATIQTSGSGTVWYKPYTASTTIGIAGGTGTLQITSGILSATTAGNLVIGRTDGTGAVDINTGSFSQNTAIYGGAMTFESNFTTPYDLTIGSTSNITLNKTFTKSSGSDATLTLKSNGDITISSAISSSNNKLNVLLNSDRDASGAGAISVGANITSNGGYITMGGGAGAITAGSGYAYGTAANTHGIYINGATINANGTANGGNIIMNGYGYTASTDSTGNGVAYGINFTAGAIQSNFAGTVTLNGTGGGTGAANQMVGIKVTGSSTITTQDGDLTLNGTGGNGTTGTGGNYGVVQSGTSVLQSTNGNIFITGTAGAVTGDGFRWAGGSVLNTNGNITISGTKVGTGFYGIETSGTNILGGSGDVGNITLISDTLLFAGTNTVQTTGTVWYKPYTASTTIGILSGTNTLQITSAMLTATTAGNLIIGRTDGTGAVNINAASFSQNTSIYGGDATFAGAVSTSGYNLTVGADRFILASGNSINAGAGTVTLAPSQAKAMQVGGSTDQADTAGSGGIFDVSAAELARITAGILNIGSTSVGGGLTVAGNLNVTGTAGTTAGAYVLNLANGGTITSTNRTFTAGTNSINFNAGGNITLSNTGALTLGNVASTGGDVSITATSGALNTGNISGTNVTISRGGASGTNMTLGNITSTAALSITANDSNYWPTMTFGNISAGTTFSATSTNAGFIFGNVSYGSGPLTITSGQGIAINGTLTMPTNYDVTLTAGTSINIGTNDINAGTGNVTLTASGGSITAHSITGNAVTLFSSANGINLGTGNITAASDVSLTAKGSTNNINTGNISGNNVTILRNGATSSGMTLGNITAASAFSMTANDTNYWPVMTFGNVSAGTTFSATANNTGFIFGNVSYGSGPLTITSGQGIAINGTLTMPTNQNVALSAGTSINIGTNDISAGTGNVSMTAGGSITAHSITGNAVTLSSAGNGINLGTGNITAASDVSIAANGSTDNINTGNISGNNITISRNGATGSTMTLGNITAASAFSLSTTESNYTPMMVFGNVSTGTTFSAVTAHSGLTFGNVNVGSGPLTITSGWGAVNINGTLTTPTNQDVNISAGTTIKITGSGISAGTGNVSLIAANGVLLDSGASGIGGNISGGNVTLNGGTYGVTVSSGKSVSSNNNGTITVTGDKFALVGSVNAGTGSVIIKPYTITKNIQIGGATDQNDSATLLDLSAAELGRITTGNLTFGRTDGTGTVAISTGSFSQNTAIYGGAMTFNNAFTPTYDLTIGSTSDITLNKTVTKSAGSDATFTLKSTGNITLSSAISSTNNKLNVVIDSDSDADQNGWIKVGGNLTSGGGNIILGGGADAATGYAYGGSTSGAQYGINIAAVTIDAGAGNITIHGNGGTYVNSSYGNIGVMFTGSTTLKGNVANIYGTGGGNSGNSGDWNNWGIGTVSGASLTTSNLSALNMYGTGGNGGGGQNYGIFIYNNITSTGSGVINLVGTAGAGTSSGAIGFNGGTVGGASYTGNITLTGTGNVGGSTIQTSSTGTITLKATGNITTGTLTTGGTDIVVDADSDADQSGWINVSGNLTSNGGNIYLGGGTDATTGYAYGGSTNTNQYGINLSSAVTINAGAGNITMHGHGGTYSNTNYGINFTGANIFTSSGTINMYGIGGTGAGGTNYGIYNSNPITASNTGTLNMYGTGGSGAAGGNTGISINSNLTSTSSGAINLIGVSGTGGTGNYSIATNGGPTYSVGGASYSGALSYSGADIILSNTSQTSGAGTISITATGNIQTGTITTGGTNIVVNVDSDANQTGWINVNGSLTSNGGNIVLGGGADPTTGYAYGDANSGTQSGIKFSGTNTINAGAGSIIMHGHGGTYTGGSNAGVLFSGATTLNSGNAITVYGIDGVGGGTDLNYGISTNGSTPLTTNGALTLNSTGNIYIASNITSNGNLTMNADSDADGVGFISINNSTITTNGGNIVLGGGADATTGYAYGGTTSGAQYGVKLSTATLNAGAGNITVHGQGGTYSSADYGIYFTGAVVLTSSGTINLYGTGGTGASGGNHGIYNSNPITASNTGTLNMYGTGGSGAAGNNTGITIGSNLTSTSSGAINLIGVSGTGGTGNYSVATIGGAGYTVGGASYSGALSYSGADVILNNTSQTSGSGTVTVTGTGNIQTGTITTAGGQILVDADSDANSSGWINVTGAITSNGGNVILGGGADATTGYAYGGSTSGTQYGIKLAATINAGAGSVTMHGHGGTYTSNNYGIYQTTGNVTMTGSGVLTMAGVAGAGTGNYDIYTTNGTIGGASYTGNISLSGDSLYLNGTLQTSGAGAITLTSTGDIRTGALTTAGGQILVDADSDANQTGAITVNGNLTSGGGNIYLGGGADATTGYAYGSSSGNSGGINFNGITIDAGSGNITAHGHGGASNSNNSLWGVNFGGGTNTFKSTGTSGTNIYGVGGSGTNSNDYGIEIYGTITTPTTGALNIYGTGGTGTNGGNIGIRMDNPSTIGSTSSGAINITALVGTAGGTTGGLFLYNNSGGAKDAFGGASYSGDITIIADNITNFGAGTTYQTTGTVWFKPYTASTTIGIAGGTGTLAIDSSTLGNITAGNLVIGRTDGTGAVAISTGSFAQNTAIYGGAMTFNNAFTPTYDLTIGSTSDITLNKTVTKSAGSDATFTLKSTGNITLSSAISSTNNKLTTIIDSDSDADSNGWISVGAGITSNGGNIYLGGGADATTGYAYGGSTNGNQQGIYFNTTGVTLDAGAGNITMHGHGGTYANNNYGINFIANTNAVTLKGGTVNMYGVGGGATDGSGSGNTGIYEGNGNATLTVTNVNTLNMYGTGGTGSGGSNWGIAYLGKLVSTGNGAMNLYGTGGTGAGGSNYGIYEYWGISSTGSGAINLTGTAGSGGSSNYSIYSQGGSSSYVVGGASYTGNISLTGTGDINLNGTLQTSSTGTVTLSATSNIITGTLTTAGGQILVDSDSDGDHLGAITVNGTLTSNNGNIYLGGGADATTGYAWGTSNGGGVGYVGITFNSVAIIDAGTGNITAHGHGGSTGTAYGIYLNGNFKSTGTTNLYGIGGSSAGGSNWGILQDYVDAKFNNASSFNLFGTGGTGGNSNYGINLRYNAGHGSITSTGSGSITLTGVGGTGTTNYDIVSMASNVLGGASYTGDITLIANSLNLAGNITTSTSGSSTVWFKPYSTGTSVGVAGGGTTPTLAVTSAVLDLVTAPNVKIGRSDGTAAFTVGARTWGSNVSFLNGSGGIVFSGAQTDGANALSAVTSGNITLNSGATITSTATSGNSIVLAAGGNFINNAGSAALTAGTSTARWIVYSSGPATDTNGSNQLLPANSVFGQTYDSQAPGSVSGTGNTWVYSTTPAGIITITADNQVRLYGDSNPTLTYSFTCSTGCLAVDAITGAPVIATAANATTGVGTATITASAGTVALTGAYSGYAVNYSSGTLTINKAHLVVTADSGKSMTYGANALPTLTATISGYKNSENATSAGVTGSAALSTTATAYNGTAGSGSNAGTYDIIAAANNLNAANYDFTYVNAVNGLTVNKAILTATADNKNRLYGASNPGFTETVTGYANGDTSSILTGSATGSSTATGTTGVGTYAITGSTGTLGTTNNNYTFAAADGTLTINKAHLLVTADDKSMTYGGNTLPGLTSTITGYVNSENATSAGVTGGASLTTSVTAYNGTAGSGSNAGTYAINAAANNLAAANYDFTYAAGTFTVNKAILTATANDKSRLYGASNPSFDQTISGYANGDTSSILSGSATASSTATNTTGVGTYTITGSTGTLDAGSNYTLAAANGTLTIGKAHLLVTADDKSMTYGGNALPGFTATITGYVNSEDATSAGVTGAAAFSTAATAYNGTAGSGSNVGAYAITAAANNLAAANYDFTYAAGTLTINKAHLLVTADNKTITYGAGSLPGLTATITGYMNGDNATSAGVTGQAALASAVTAYNGTAGSASDAGNYAITAAANNLNAANYDFSYADGVFTVNRAQLTVVADAKTMASGTTEPLLTYNYTGLVAGDTSASFTGALAHTTGFGAGNYTIYRNSLAATGNYVIGTYTPGVFTVTGVPNIAEISNALPKTVARVAQDASLNRPVDSTGMLGATVSTILWHEGADVPTLSRTTRKLKPFITGSLTLLSPSASSYPIDPMSDEQDATYNVIEILEE